MLEGFNSVPMFKQRLQRKAAVQQRRVEWGRFPFCFLRIELHRQISSQTVRGTVKHRGDSAAFF
ncbi:hypothetical protein A6P54_10280 [Bacillus sp. MKU004]|nr:hypothetical protein A6P54_10280 [Bacillus sp. MKU004]